MARDRFADTHVDNGMRHSGLVPTAEERREEQWLKDALAREARISARAARSDLAIKVLEVVEGEIGGSLATEHNSSVRQVATALRDLFQREGIELQLKQDAPLI